MFVHIKLYTTQVVSLDEQCTPQSLLSFPDSNQFAIICARLSSQLGSFNTTNSRVALSPFERYSDPTQPHINGAILITSGVDIKIVTLISGNLVEIYSVNDRMSVSSPLPPNVNCLNTSNSILSPLHAKPAVLLQCNTTQGRVAYVIPIPIHQGMNARSIPADGLLHSSRDGTYTLVVNGALLKIYSSEGNSHPGRPVVLDNQITAVENLDSDRVHVLTEEEQHVILNLKSGSLTHMPGGFPVLSEWVESSNHYIYLTRDNKIITIHETSTEPEYEPKLIANQPELMLFVEAAVTITPSPSPSSDVVPDPSQPPRYNYNVGAIIGGSGGGLAIAGLILSLSVVAIVFVGKRKNPTRFQRFFCIQSDREQSEVHLEVGPNDKTELVEVRRREDPVIPAIPTPNPTPPPDQATDPPVPPTEGNNDRPQRHMDTNTPPFLFLTSHLSENEPSTTASQQHPREDNSTSMTSEIPSIYPPPISDTDRLNLQPPAKHDACPAAFGPVLVSNDENASSGYAQMAESEKNTPCTDNDELVS